MKVPSIPKRPGFPLSDGEVLIGHALAYADHREGFVPSEVVATSKRIALASRYPTLTQPIMALILIWIAGLILFASGAFVLGGVTWFAGLAAFIGRMYFVVPKVLEAFPLESVVLCTSENELNLSKGLRVTLDFASGARWRLRPSGGGLLRPRDHIALILRRAGLVVTEKK